MSPSSQDPIHAAQPHWPARALMLAVRAYQLLISPNLGNNCRFTPSCSAYSLQALGQYGALRGSYLTLQRLVRCQPWCAGGHDPVPEQLTTPRFFTRFFPR